MKQVTIILFVFMLLSVSCINNKKVITPLMWAKKMADSDMKRNPDPAKLDFSKNREWSYCQGLVCLANQRLSEVTGERKYDSYALKYAKEMIDDSGNISTYNKERYNLDMIKSGDILYKIYQDTKEERYRKAIYTLRDQLRKQPRTSEGGFWHKKVYKNQMWLDGIYMANPFYARFGKEFNDPEAFKDVANQIKLIQEHTKDSITGLNVHGWNSDKQEKWADPETGKSHHVWGRAQGWYLMAMVDILDFMPDNSLEKNKILFILKEVAEAVKIAQDKKSGVWYQVMDEPNREGNYLEATCSSMFVYAFLKGSRKGYLDDSFREAGEFGYKGLLKNFVREKKNGMVSLIKCCAVAGLGGKPYRDGSFSYYTTTLIRDNDPKGVGPFIMACIEMNLAEKDK